MSELDNEEVQDAQVEPLAAESVAPENDDQKPIFNKIQMQDVINREKQKAFERGQKSMQEQLQQQAQQQPQVEQQPAQQPINPGQMGGVQQLSADQIRQMIHEQAPIALQQQVHESKMQAIGDQFAQKMKAAEAKYPGLEEQLNKLDWSHLGPLIKMVNDMENSGDIMKEIVMDNPVKLANISLLSHTQPHLAQKSLYDLSNSIKQNLAAQAQEDTSNDPLSPIKPSNVGSDNGSKGSIRDFKARYRG